MYIVKDAMPPKAVHYLVGVVENKYTRQTQHESKQLVKELAQNCSRK